MDFFTILFFLFSFALLYSAFMVISTRNPVHSVLFLILVFCNSAPLFILLGAEFLAFLLVVVYVGAIAVLFLFVVMMLDIRVLEQPSPNGFFFYYPVVLAVLSLLCFFSIRYFYVPTLGHYSISFPPVSTQVFRGDNVFLFANLLYSFFSLYFFLAALVLLVAMVGAIVLTFSNRRQSLRQEYYRQVDASPAGITYGQKHRF